MHLMDEEFNDLMLKDIRIEISKAFILLEANIRKLTKRRIDAKQITSIQNKAEQMKKEINSFIDSQVERILKESKLPGETCFQDSEQ